jgi:Flp pilus assembly protein TadD
MPRHEISEATVVAMYFNNRAAEALSAGDVDNAYWWARASTAADPGFTSGVNTLGVIYVRRGDTAAAEQAFAHVLAREPGNTRAMSNLAYALQQAGRDDEAAQWRRRLAQLEPYPPFHWFDLGRTAMDRGDAAAARDLFAREVDRMPYYHEFHYWLALADFRLGDLDAARKHLLEAREHSTNPREQGLYAAKLAWLMERRAR